MRFSSLALVALGVTEALAIGIPHRHFFKRSTTNIAITPVVPVSSVSSGTKVVTAGSSSGGSSSGSGSSSGGSSSGSSSSTVDLSRLTSLGFTALGVNAQSAGSTPVWIGSDGPYTNQFVNAASESIIVVVWGNQGSWVNAVQPYITLGLSPGQTSTVSFANGVSGAWSAVYSNTQLVNGQISNTWGEFTFSNPYSTFDVSREPNMSGRSMKISSPNCYSDMNTCVFQCNGGVNICMVGYSLINCATGSQVGAQYGTYGGAASGGCGGLGATGALTTTFS